MVWFDAKIHFTVTSQIIKIFVLNSILFLFFFFVKFLFIFLFLYFFIPCLWSRQHFLADHCIYFICRSNSSAMASKKSPVLRYWSGVTLKLLKIIFWSAKHAIGKDIFAFFYLLDHISLSGILKCGNWEKIKNKNGPWVQNVQHIHSSIWIISISNIFNKFQIQNITQYLCMIFVMNL